MPKAQSHLLQQKALNLFLKRDLGEALALWLNTCKGTKVEWEFSEAIRYMNGATARIADALRESLDGPCKWRSPAAGKKFMRILKRNSIYLPRILTEARAGFALASARFDLEAASFSTDKRWALVWEYPGERRQPSDVFRKAQALNCIITLTKYGRLDRMRECARCGKWLYARFSHQRFCSTKCQQTHYWKSPEWRAHRREWMREYRNLNA